MANNYKQVILKDPISGDYLIPVSSYPGSPNDPFVKKSEFDTALSKKADNPHVHTVSDVTGLQNEIDTLKTSVSSGKAAIASAVTDKGVQTAADAAFQTIAENIGKIPTGFNPDLSGLTSGAFYMFDYSGNSGSINSCKLEFNREEIFDDVKFKLFMVNAITENDNRSSVETWAITFADITPDNKLENIGVFSNDAYNDADKYLTPSISYDVSKRILTIDCKVNAFSESSTVFALLIPDMSSFDIYKDTIKYVGNNIQASKLNSVLSMNTVSHPDIVPDMMKIVSCTGHITELNDRPSDTDEYRIQNYVRNELITNKHSAVPDLSNDRYIYKSLQGMYYTVGTYGLRNGKFSLIADNSEPFDTVNPYKVTVDASVILYKKKS